MKTFLLILFFGKSVLLTSTPIDLGASWTVIEFSKPISAITGGAALSVDVTTEIGYKTNFEAMRKQLPDHTILAELVPERGETIVLSNSSFRHSNKDVSAILNPVSAIPAGVKFKRLRIRSTKLIRNVSLTWNNYKQ